MSTYTQILYQLVWGGKNYTFFLTKENEQMLFKYIVGILKNKNCFPYAVGGYGNHIHIITSLHPSVALADLVKDIKTDSNKFMNENKEQFTKFRNWQVGYGAFTYHIELKQTLINYAKKQRRHHEKLSYKEELIGLLEEFEIEYDEKYLLL